ncbi:hypothetical protein NLI96_g6947 [Meripilus lineatus]|uniref:Survival protein SurE-like phosphatase/nucleotidase domain-containing protein n=1 Tax=Meripilus lineatus TaxID=2056292 RepID=A0AAD5V047_9APHY|nr:hypothetical protein NLI96_g6947 [Physisporinus lineatus]
MTGGSRPKANETPEVPSNDADDKTQWPWFIVKVGVLGSPPAEVHRDAMKSLSRVWHASLCIIFALLPCALSLNILLTNDDSWASANIRATYDALKADGHDVLLVGPAVQQSGKGGTFVVPTVNITPPGGEFGSIPVGAPYFGHEVNNPDIFYFNGTPAATAIFGIDILVPQHFGKKKLDLVVSGPNEGKNNGPFVYTLSGTIGAAYNAVGRGIPAIAFSAGNNTHRSFTTNTGAADDPANIVGRLTADLVAAVAHGVNTKKDRLLPLGVGINVNYPTFGPGNNCTQVTCFMTASPDTLLTHTSASIYHNTNDWRSHDEPDYH